MACQHRCEVDSQKAGDSFSRWQEQYEEWRNERDGKRHTAPFGVHPGQPGCVMGLGLDACQREASRWWLVCV